MRYSFPIFLKKKFGLSPTWRVPLQRFGGGWLLHDCLPISDGRYSLAEIVAGRLKAATEDDTRSV